MISTLAPTRTNQRIAPLTNRKRIARGLTFGLLVFGCSAFVGTALAAPINVTYSESRLLAKDGRVWSDAYDTSLSLSPRVVSHTEGASKVTTSFDWGDTCC